MSIEPFLTSIPFIVAGILFVLYPAVRPFSDEQTMDGARTFASDRWVVAHSFALAGFILLGLGLLGLRDLLRGSVSERWAQWGLVVGWFGVGLTLPYYGAEVFGLHAVGREVIARNDVGLMSLVDSIRWGAGIWFILLGLVAIAVAALLFAVALWRAASYGRWGGVVLATAFALYIPQFAASHPVRVLHGLLVFAGCWLIARGVLRQASGMA
ncbi:MAG: hypothetical protein R3C39_11655 [Dehalococcoidia bacterium]